MIERDEVRSTLFPREVASSDQTIGKVLLEQYKLFVGTSESLVARRQTANSFFFTVTSALFGTVGLILRQGFTGPAAWLVMLPLGVAGIPLCWAWHRLIRSYRQLNEGKFKVIQLLEEKLPARVFAAEWKALGEGQDPNRYKPFVSSELWIPWLFGVAFALLAVIGLCGAIWTDLVQPYLARCFT